jgi:hypothetical protein
MKTKIIAAVMLMISLPISGELNEDAAINQIPNYIGCGIGTLSLEIDEIVVIREKLYRGTSMEIEGQLTTFNVPAQQYEFTVYDVCIEPKEIDLDPVAAQIEEAAANIREKAEQNLEGLPPGIALECNPNLQSRFIQNPTTQQILNDGCRSLNSIIGNCEENGDCECGSQDSDYHYLLDDTYPVRSPDPVIAKDTDRDGVSDDDDPDDDCDRLGDEMERMIGTSPTVADDPMDMTGFGVGDGIFEITLTKVCGVSDMDGPMNGSDPYLQGQINLARHSSRSEIGTEDRGSGELELGFDGFTESDHPSGADITNGCVDEERLGGSLRLSLPTSFDDPNYQKSGGQPELELLGALYDDDGDDPSDLITPLGSKIRLFNMAMRAGSIDAPAERFELVHDSVTIGFEVKVGLDKCVMAWAKGLMEGDAYVSANGLSCLGDYQ